jgi:hypothetical protein
MEGEAAALALLALAPSILSLEDGTDDSNRDGVISFFHQIGHQEVKAQELQP